jgi:hypothetical protein
MNFSMFGSVKSGHSDSQSVKGQAQPPASKQSEINFEEFGAKQS